MRWRLLACSLAAAAAASWGCTVLLGANKDYEEGAVVGDAGGDVANVPPDAPPGDAQVLPDGATCAAPTIACPGGCLDPRSDPKNCGACGITCSAGYTCSSGVCGNAVVEVAPGGVHACVRLGDGTVWCWGDDRDGELGQPAMGDQVCGALPCRPTPTKVPGLTGVTRIAAGSLFTCALESDGSVWCWGLDSQGQTGHAPIAADAGGTTCNTNDPCDRVPVRVASLPPASDISAGSAHACALTTAGAVYCWGSNVAGNLGRGTLAGGFAAVPAVVPTLTADVSKIAVGLDNHTCAIKTDGTAWCWGQNPRACLGHAPALDPKDTGGNAYSSTPTVVTDGTKTITDFVSIYAGFDVSCGRRTSAGYVCWGHDGWGQLGAAAFDTADHAIPAAVTIIPNPIATFSMRYIAACTTDSAGVAWCWGANPWGEIGDGTIAGTACENATPCRTTATSLPALGKVTEIVAGGQFAIARGADGRIWTWGDNTDGRLGHAPGTAGDRTGCNGVTTASCNPTPQVLGGLP